MSCCSSTISLLTGDSTATRRFYNELLGMPSAENEKSVGQNETELVFEVGSGNRLRFQVITGTSPRTEGIGRLDLFVPSQEELLLIVNRLREARVSLRTGHSETNRGVYLRDPNGYPLSIAVARPPPVLIPS